MSKLYSSLASLIFDMLPAPSYDSLTSQLGCAFESRYQGAPSIFATGLLLARPELIFVRNEVLPHIEHLDLISADFVDYFMVGYSDIPLSGNSETTAGVCKNSDGYFSFSSRDFVGFQRALEADYSTDQLSWRYSGGCDLLMMNARFDRESRRAELGFENVMSFNVEAALTSGAFSSFSNLITTFTQLLEHQDPTNPVRALSDQLGVRIGTWDLWENFMSLLPFKLRKSHEKLRHFATHQGAKKP